MTSRRGTLRAALPLLLGTGALWLAIWAVAARARWQPHPAALLAALLLGAALVWLLRAVVESGTSPLPRAQLRVTAASPAGKDSRLLRHQMQLEDAASDPPSCRPVLTHIVELADERRRLHDGSRISGPGSEAAGVHLWAVLKERPPDRTQLSPRHLTALVDELEAL